MCNPVDLVYSVSEARSAAPQIAGLTCTAAVDEGASWLIACERIQNPAPMSFRLRKDLASGERLFDFTAADCLDVLPFLYVELL